MQRFRNAEKSDLTLFDENLDDRLKIVVGRVVVDVQSFENVVFGRWQRINFCSFEVICDVGQDAQGDVANGDDSLIPNVVRRNVKNLFVQ